MGKEQENKVNPNIAADVKAMLPIFDLVKVGIVVTDKKSNVLYVNPAFSEVTEYPHDEIIGEKAGFNRSGYHDENYYKKMWTSLLANGFWIGEIWNRAKFGRIYPSLLTITAIKSLDNITNYIGIVSDITFLEADKEKKINLAFYDPLTKLPNRLSVENNFNISWQKESDKSNLKIAFLFFDLNKFKSVNDTHGHVVGDKLLLEISDRIRKISRSTDVISRFGGDEFVGIFPGIKEENQVNEICERILSIFEKPFLINNIEIHSSASIGVSFYPSEGNTLEDLIKTADEAMYYSKKHNIKYVFYKDLDSLKKGEK